MGSCHLLPPVFTHEESGTGSLRKLNHRLEAKLTEMARRLTGATLSDNGYVVLTRFPLVSDPEDEGGGRDLKAEQETDFGSQCQDRAVRWPYVVVVVVVIGGGGGVAAAAAAAVDSRCLSFVCTKSGDRSVHRHNPDASCSRCRPSAIVAAGWRVGLKLAFAPTVEIRVVSIERSSGGEPIRTVQHTHITFPLLPGGWRVLEQ